MSESAEAVPTGIGGWQAIGIYRRVTWKRLLRGRLRWALYAKLAIPLVLAIVIDIIAVAGGRASAGVDLFDNLCTYFRFVVLSMAALSTSSIISEEIESKTFTFLFARPAPRWAMPIGKYVAAMSICCVAFTVSIVVAYCLAMIPAGGSDFVEHIPRLCRSIVALWLGLLATGALSTLIGCWFTRYPFVMVMMVLLITEGLFNVAKLPVGSMRWHMANLVRPEPAAMIFTEFNVAAWISMVTLAGITALCLFLAAISVSGAEYRADS